jgi:hypothetical protein
MMISPTWFWLTSLRARARSSIRVRSGVSSM